MYVIIANEAREMLSHLDIDVMKSVEGVHTAEEIVSMFKNFFYARMILDVTAIEDYDNITNIQNLPVIRLLYTCPAQKSAFYTLCVSSRIPGLHLLRTNHFPENLPAWYIP